MAVLSSDAFAADEPESFEFAEAMVIRVGSQRFTSAGGEIEGPVPFLAGELVVGGGCADFCEEVSGVEPGAGGDCDEVLAEDINGGVVGLASYDLGARPATGDREGDWPDLMLARYPAMLAFDHQDRAVRLMGRGDDPALALAAVDRAEAWRARIEAGTGRSED